MSNFGKDMERERTYQEGYERGRKEGHEITACVEAELSKKCEKLNAENAKLMLVNGDLQEQIDSMETELYLLRAQLDMVHLIFGGKQCGKS